MSKPKVRVYDNNMNLLALLENSFDVGYDLRLNQLWMAHFSMPDNDPKNDYLQPFTYVEVYDEDDTRIELFRILPLVHEKTEIGIKVYTCEHVLATLIDDVLFQYHEIGGLGVFTNTILSYILGKQTVTNWVLGTNEFSRQFLYKWENENLLSALFSVPKPFLEVYKWAWDTTSYPWTLNLVEIEDTVDSYIRYGKNMRGIRKTIDPTNLCTRLYCLGYGEGVNQLNIMSVNANLPYLDAPSIPTYGIKAKIFVDRRFEDAESLKARGLALLAELQVPYVSYEFEAADISSITSDPVDKFRVGTYTRAIDTELNENVKAIVVGVAKGDITGNPGDVRVVVANKPQDIATSIAELADRQRINEVYAQGATNLDSREFLDNCDPNYPAVIRFYVPEETVNVNKVLLSYQSSNFRSYSKAIQGGGGAISTTASGGASTQTSSSGGGVSTTTASGGALTTSSTTKSESVSIGIYSSKSGPSVDDTLSSSHSHTGITDIVGGHGHFVSIPNSGSHTHGIPNHGHTVNVAGHNHDVSIPNHQHAYSVPNHTHSVNTPSHQHGITIPDHVHQIEYGIFAGPTPTAVVVKVDGNTIAGLGTFENDINIIPYLAKDAGGRILRGWHEITITPNNLGRINANVTMQVFVQSRGDITL